MTVTAKVLTGALTADSTPTSFTSSGFGTAEAAIVFVTNANSNVANPSPALLYSVGFWDGTVQYASAIYAASGTTNNPSSRYRNSNRIAVFKTWNLTSHTTVAEYTLSSITDGVELALSEDGTSVTRYATVILLKGLKNRKVGNFAFNGDSSAKNVTDVGFKPTMLFYVHPGSPTAYTTTDVESDLAYMSLGVAHCSSAGTITQCGVSYATQTGVSTSVVNSSTNDNKIARIYVGNGSVLNVDFELSDFDADGFTVTPSETSSSIAFYLAIELNDPDEAYVGIVDSRTSTGTSEPYTGVGFQPILLGLLSTTETATNGTSTTPGGAVMIGATDGTTQQALNFGIDDGATSAAAFSEANTSNILDLMFDTSAAGSDAVASFSAFGTDGFTLNYSDASASARKMIAWAIGSDATATVPTLSASTYVTGSLTSTGWRPQITAS